MPISTLREKDFLGRSEELSDLYRRSLDVERGIARRILLAGARGIGKTELLSQLYNRLFWTQDKVAPFYYSANNAILCAADFSKDYFTQFFRQRLAFEKRSSPFSPLTACQSRASRRSRRSGTQPGQTSSSNDSFTAQGNRSMPSALPSAPRTNRPLPRESPWWSWLMSFSGSGASGATGMPAATSFHFLKNSFPLCAQPGSLPEARRKSGRCP